MKSEEEKEKCEEEKTQLRVGCESTIQYMGNVMLEHNKVMLEGQKLLGSQGNMLRFEEEKTKTGAPTLTSAVLQPPQPYHHCCPLHQLQI